MGQEDPLEKEMATHSSILAWEIPRTEQPGGLQSRGHKELDMCECAHMHHGSRGKGQSLPGLLEDSNAAAECPACRTVPDKSNCLY